MFQEFERTEKKCNKICDYSFNIQTDLKGQKSTVNNPKVTRNLVEGAKQESRGAQMWKCTSEVLVIEM